MTDPIFEMLMALDSLPGLAGLFVLWLLYRLSPRHPMQMARRAGRVFANHIGISAPVDVDLVIGNLEPLLEESSWAHHGMSSWRKKAVDVWLDELVDLAVEAQLNVSESMARFSSARHGFHEAVEGQERSVDLPAVVRALHLACLELGDEVRAVGGHGFAELHGGPALFA